jgi:hypothetical protein
MQDRAQVDDVWCVWHCRIGRDVVERALAKVKNLGLENDAECTIYLAAISRTAHLSYKQHAVNDIHDILKAYEI